MNLQQRSTSPPSESRVRRGITLETLQFWYLAAEYLGRELNYLLDINANMSAFLLGRGIDADERDRMKSLIDEVLQRWLYCAKALRRPDASLQAIKQLRLQSAELNFRHFTPETFRAFKQDLTDEFAKYAGKRLRSRSARHKVCKKRHVDL
ncbi:MAG: hypothetical protein AAF704_13075 [Cyanobacteria bacterium P01_D01_bin.123]